MIILKYELKYDVTIYEVPVATMLPFTKYGLLSYHFAALPRQQYCLKYKLNMVKL